MKKRGILSRINAKKSPGKKEAKAPPVVETKIIQMVDTETEEVLEEFSSLEDAIEKQGLNRPNLIGAIKNGNKYKGFHWKKV